MKVGVRKWKFRCLSSPLKIRWGGLINICMKGVGCTLRLEIENVPST